MSALIQLNGYELNLEHGEPMIQDLALAQKLGYAQPRDIRKLIKRMVERGFIHQTQIRATVARLTNSQESTEYLLSEKAALKVITKSETETADKITDEVIDVFMAYRSGKLPSSQSLNPVNMTRIQLLELAMQAEQERLALEHKVEEMQPKVEALDRIATAEGSVNMTEAAKILQMKPTKLIKWLESSQWIYRRVGNKNWLAHQNRIDSGLMEHKVSTYVDQHTEEERVSFQARITPKGLAKLSEKLTQLALVAA